MNTSFINWRGTFALLSLLSAVSNPTAAQSTPSELPRTVITPARAAQTLDAALPATTVITRSDLQRWQRSDLVSTLAREAGVEFAQTGGPGGVASLFVRGANSSQVLVLVDGVRLNSPNGGAAALGGIAVDSIERIEIVRGNLSSLYGSAAIGGVVQIFTRGGRGPGWSAAVEGGQGGTRSASASGAIASGTVRIGGSIAARRSEQFSAIDAAQVVPGPFAAGANPDLDGNRHANGAIGLTYRPRDGTQFAVNAWGNDNRTDFDSTFDGPAATHVERSRVAAASASARHFVTKAWQTEVQLGAMRDRSRNRSSEPFSFDNSRFVAENQQISWVNEVTVAKDVAAQLGVELLLQDGASTAFDPAFSSALTAFSRNVRSGWFGVAGGAGPRQLQINVRHDRYSDVGGATSGLVSYGYRLTPRLRATVQASTAFRAPSFSDLYFPLFGNPNLAPEKSRSAEVGLQYAAGVTTLRAAIFRTDTRALIVYDPMLLRAENIDRARVTGFETLAATRFGPWYFDANLSVVRALDQGSGERLLRRAPYRLNASALYDVERWRAGVEFTHSGRRADLDVNTFQRIELDAYTVARVIAAVRVTRQMTVEFRIENVTDTRYQTVSGYNVQPRTALVGVTWLAE